MGQPEQCATDDFGVWHDLALRGQSIGHARAADATRQAWSNERTAFRAGRLTPPQETETAANPSGCGKIAAFAERSTPNAFANRPIDSPGAGRHDATRLVLAYFVKASISVLIAPDSTRRTRALM
jgi:hypothetical protein